MKQLRILLTAEPAARRLLFAHIQSSLGNGAAYVALMALAYERFHSPLAVSAVLLCEIVPSILLGAVLGAAADRWPRRAILVSADVLRVGAFVGLAMVDSLGAMIAFAALAGVGQAAFQPAVMASLPAVVEEDRLPAVTGLYGAIQEFGYTVGPVLAAGALLVVDTSGVLLVNAATFAVSAALLSTVALGRGAADAGARKPSLLASARDGARALRRNRTAWTVVLSSACFVLFFGAMNVADLVLVQTSLGGGAAGYAIVTATMGLGVTAGSLLAARAGSARRLYLGGIALCAAGMAGCAIAPGLAVALVAFLAIGVGNGLALVSENVLLQQIIPDEIKGRVFGLKAAMISSSFLVAYFGGGLLVAAVGPRTTFALIAAGSLLVWATARTVLAPARLERAEPVPVPA